MSKAARILIISLTMTVILIVSITGIAAASGPNYEDCPNYGDCPNDGSVPITGTALMTVPAPRQKLSSARQPTTSSSLTINSGPRGTVIATSIARISNINMA